MSGIKWGTAFQKGTRDTSSSEMSLQPLEIPHVPSGFRALKTIAYRFSYSINMLEKSKLCQASYV